MVFSHKKNTIICYLICFLVFLPELTSQELNIDYYGVVSQATDVSMLKMAQDMIFTQLKTIDRLSVDDKRPDNSQIINDIPDINLSQAHHIAFYTKIDKVTESDVMWQCTFIAQQKSSEQSWTKAYTFESYYKILVNSKSILEDLFSEIKTSDKAYEKTFASTPSSQSSSLANLENLAGNWEGESFADKIIILRGGRGFIVLKNGATMNIRISVKNTNSSGNITEISIKQTGAVNASFFPDIPRESALKYAADAQPIEWIFTINSDMSLAGVKNTLVFDGKNPDSIQQGKIDTVWYKK